MTSLGAVRTALKGRLEVISGLRVYDLWPEQVNVPCAIIMPPESGQFAEHQLTFTGDLSRYSLEILVLVQFGTLRSAQTEADALLSATSTGSIHGALDADRTLGGVVHYVNVLPLREYGTIPANGLEYFGAVVPVEVWAG